MDLDRGRPVVTTSDIAQPSIAKGEAYAASAGSGFAATGVGSTRGRWACGPRRYSLLGAKSGNGLRRARSTMIGSR